MSRLRMDNDPTQQQTPSEHDHGDRNPHGPESRSPTSPNEGWNAEEKEHRAAERCYWKTQNIIAGGTVFLAAVAASGAGFSALFSHNAVVEAHKQVIEARRQADEAKRQADTAQDMEKKQLRAYVVVSELKEEPIGNNGFSRVSPIIKNAGLTPATDVWVASMTPRRQIWLNISPAEEKLQEMLDVPPDPDQAFSVSYMPKLSNISIGPGGTVTDSVSLQEELPPTAALDSMNGKIGKYFFGSVRYKDIFGDSHVSKYCFRIDAMIVRPRPRGQT